MNPLRDQFVPNLLRAKQLMAGPGFGAPGLSMRDTIKKMVKEGVPQQDAYFACVAAKIELERKGINVRKAVDLLARRYIRSLNP